MCNSAYGVSDAENSHHVSHLRPYYVQTKDSVLAIRISDMILLGICIPAVSFCQRVLFLLLRCSLKTGWKRTTGTLHHVMRVFAIGVPDRKGIRSCTLLVGYILLILLVCTRIVSLDPTTPWLISDNSTIANHEPVNRSSSMMHLPHR